MSETSERDALTTSPFAGLVPSRVRLEAERAGSARHLAVRETTRDHSRVTKGLLGTVPVLLVGSIALATLNLTPTDGASATPKRPHDKSDTSDLGAVVKAALARTSANATPSISNLSGPDASSQGQAQADPQLQTPEATLSTAAVPTHYTVERGDTVSGIAGRYHLSTASVLALNGLSWKSLIFPGQVLKLTKTATAPKPPTPVKSAPKPSAPVVKAPPKTPTKAPSTASTKYTIKSGDTVTSIAKKYGVTIQAILTANKLTISSIIYAGRTLVIPGSSSATKPTSTGGTSTGGTSTGGTQPAQVGGTVTPLSPEMKTNASAIIAVGKKLGVPDYGIIIALAAAAQESGLRNLSGGDLDSVGLFQQRPSTGWGTPAQLQNTTYASELFFGGPSNPNKGKTRGLLDIKGWQSMTLTQAAQAVQISAYPTAYAKWETSARAWYASLT
jgi:LysM repeat protein